MARVQLKTISQLYVRQSGHVTILTKQRKNEISWVEIPRKLLLLLFLYLFFNARARLNGQVHIDLCPLSCLEYIQDVLGPSGYLTSMRVKVMEAENRMSLSPYRHCEVLVTSLDYPFLDLNL